MNVFTATAGPIQTCRRQSLWPFVVWHPFSSSPLLPHSAVPPRSAPLTHTLGEMHSLVLGPTGPAAWMVQTALHYMYTDQLPCLVLRTRTSDQWIPLFKLCSTPPNTHLLLLPSAQHSLHGQWRDLWECRHILSQHEFAQLCLAEVGWLRNRPTVCTTTGCLTVHNTTHNMKGTKHITLSLPNWSRLLR